MEIWWREVISITMVILEEFPAPGVCIFLTMLPGINVLPLAVEIVNE